MLTVLQISLLRPHMLFTTLKQRLSGRRIRQVVTRNNINFFSYRSAILRKNPCFNLLSKFQCYVLFRTGPQRLMIHRKRILPIPINKTLLSVVALPTNGNLIPHVKTSDSSTVAIDSLVSLQKRMLDILILPLIIAEITRQRY